MTRRLGYLPALLVTTGLFGAGLLLAAVQSLGGLPVTGEADWSVAAYRAVFRSHFFWSALGMSAWIAGAGTLAAAALGTLAALVLWRLRAGTILRFLFAWNLPVPHVVGAWITLLLFSQSGLWSRLAHAAGVTRTPADFPALVNDPLAVGVLLELAWKEVPFVGLAVLAALTRFDRRLLDVARSLGASRWVVFWRVVLPAVQPALVSASLLVFTFAFSSFEVPYLLGPTSPATLPVLAYRAFSDPDLTARPMAMALCVVIAGLAGLVVLAWALLSLRGRGRP
ncbi:ABC transporter permease subunit (plasmid) [Deinococcus taeanensis]|uniref:ABC transporter permease n=1 Tax=Deinococcus taeanensis TaxID=2737050 RepID=UPI001CDBCE30|nr:ABC transporter permease subunit [Deinococcus taeanensis]UBV44546.1 ABC transporter permease subunit [Deinococcus taeanensis]